MKLDEITHTLILNQYNYLFQKYYYPFHDEEDFEYFMKARLCFHFPTTDIDEVYEMIRDEHAEKIDDFPEISWENDTTTESEQEDYERFGLHLTP
jgi:hypothetical protein